MVSSKFQVLPGFPSVSGTVLFPGIVLRLLLLGLLGNTVLKPPPTVHLLLRSAGLVIGGSQDACAFDRKQAREKLQFPEDHAKEKKTVAGEEGNGLKARERTRLRRLREVGGGGWRE